MGFFGTDVPAPIIKKIPNTHADQAQMSVSKNIPDTISVNGTEKSNIRLYLHANHATHTC